MKISDKEMTHLAELSGLTLTKTEMTNLQQDLERILEYVSQLNEVDTEGVEPTYQTFDLENVTRADVPIDYGVTKEQLLALAPEVKDGMIAVGGVL
ncbi:Asp-tRNA(Asn)/Glu-tRNA(Gln) amidotransferase subunit GatC [Candidatus Saccharibacteria bacterium]|nr:Asp-tRNA(Asn)/Glu-tRNA(Gln) amidotransferase subunit GatC [Candidatus Saccharibacteria bacterium]